MLRYIISILYFGEKWFIICVEFTGMWIRGRQKAHQQSVQENLYRIRTWKLARNASFFVFITRCIRAMVARTTFVRRGAVGYTTGRIAPENRRGQNCCWFFEHPDRHIPVAVFLLRGGNDAEDFIAVYANYCIGKCGNNVRAGFFTDVW